MTSTPTMNGPGSNADRVELSAGSSAAPAGERGVVCGHCHQGMLAAASCTQGVLVLAGRRYARRRGRGARRQQRCGGCHVSAGGVHHLGCDHEPCPRCRGQLISCGCLDAGYRLEPHDRG